MKLNYQGIQDKMAWKAANITLPAFDWKQISEKTKKNPIWLHFGAGNIFRGFIARLQQRLLEQGLVKEGIIAAETFDFEIIDKIYKPYSNMAIMAGLKPNGEIEKEIVASITEALCVNPLYPDDMARLKEIIREKSLQLISFTITEKGYALTDIEGNDIPVVRSDMEKGPSDCSHIISIITACLWERYLVGAYPIALVSMDNCSHNGEKLSASILTVAEIWQKKGFVSINFIKWLKNKEKVSFPWSMIDKITPRPSKKTEELLTAAGVEDMSPIVTKKNTYIAPFVNTEIPQYLVIEDNFPNGRPPLEQAGVYMTTRDIVNAAERMKVTTCLNPLHTTLAIFGCLLGYHSIAEEMNDPQLRKLVEQIGYKEGLPVVTDPGILSPKQFLKEVLMERLPNPFLPDTPQRIATDTSQKLAIRFGETIKAYKNNIELQIGQLTFIPLTIAGWFRYLIGIDDNGNQMPLSPDPMLEQLTAQLSNITLGCQEEELKILDNILSNVSLFGSDLVAIGLADKIKKMFYSMLKGDGAVREILKEHLTEI